MINAARDRTIRRDVNVALAPDADPEAKPFFDFLNSDRAAAIMKTEGWVR